MVIVLLTFCCIPQKELKTIEGDLYYEWLKLGNFYGQPDSVLANFKTLMDSVGYEGLMKEDSVFAVYIKLLDDNDLLVAPYVYVMTDEEKKLLLYLKPEDYKSLNHFTYKELLANNQKVRIVAKVDSLVDNRFVCKELISVDVMNGATLPQRSKFKLEDYR